MHDLIVPTHDGIELAVRDHDGPGPDVIFVHGVGRTMDDWSQVLEHTKGMRAVTFDQRWHGRSGNTGTFDIHHHVRDVETIARALELDNPAVVGHSFGGTVAFMYGVLHPEAPGVANFDGWDWRQADLYDMDRAEVDDMLTKAAEQTGRMRPPPGPDLPPDEFWPLMAAMDVIDIIDLTRAVTCPALFVKATQVMPGKFGEAGLRGIDAAMRNIAAERGTFRYETIDSSHFVINEQPEACAMWVAELLAGVAF